MTVIISILCSALVIGTPILYACLGEIFTERSGTINLGLEGIMLVGAISGYRVVINTGSLGLAMLAVVAAGAVLGLFYAFLTVTLRANQIVAGLALVTFGTGLSGTMGKGFSGGTTKIFFASQPIPLLSKIPILGDLLFKYDLLVYAAVILVLLSWFFIFRTRPGLRLRALGENPGALDAAGLKVFLLKYVYIIIGSVLTAVGGAYVTLSYTCSWQDQITSGKGWIAASLVIFAAWNPLLALVGAVLFGGIMVLALRMQMWGVNISSYFLSTLPYLATIVVLILSTGSFTKRRSQGPLMLGRSYDREAR